MTSRENHFLSVPYKTLEKALRAFASSSGGAACPGGRGVGVRGQPRGLGGDPKVIPRRFKRKKIFVTYVRTDVSAAAGWTDRRACRNSVLDMHITKLFSSVLVPMNFERISQIIHECGPRFSRFLRGLLGIRIKALFLKICL